MSIMSITCLQVTEAAKKELREKKQAVLATQSSCVLKAKTAEFAGSSACSGKHNPTWHAESNIVPTQTNLCLFLMSSWHLFAKFLLPIFEFNESPRKCIRNYKPARSAKQCGLEDFKPASCVGSCCLGSSGAHVHWTLGMTFLSD